MEDQKPPATPPLRGAALAAAAWDAIIESELAASRGEIPSMFWDQGIWYADDDHMAESHSVPYLSPWSGKHQLLSELESRNACGTAGCFAGFVVHIAYTAAGLQVSDVLWSVSDECTRLLGLSSDSVVYSALYAGHRSLGDIADALREFFPGIELRPVPESVTAMYDYDRDTR